MRNHVNPLGERYAVPCKTPTKWAFSDCTRPLVLDIGSAKGHCVLRTAKLHASQRPPSQQFNYIGLEIREPLVVRGNLWRDEAKLDNLEYLWGNVNVGSIEAIANALPPMVLSRVMIQCPDPWFKKKHQKRRMVNAALATSLARVMKEGAIVFVMSDVLEIARQMVEVFQSVAGAEGKLFTRTNKAEHGALGKDDGEGHTELTLPGEPGFRGEDPTKITHPKWHEEPRPGEDWLPHHPYAVQSEREKATLLRGLPVFRALFVRTSVACEAS